MGLLFLKFLHFATALVTSFENFIDGVHPNLLFLKVQKMAPAFNVILQVLYNNYACLIDGVL